MAAFSMDMGESLGDDIVMIGPYAWPFRVNLITGGVLGNNAAFGPFVVHVGRCEVVESAVRSRSHPLARRGLIKPDVRGPLARAMAPWSTVKCQRQTRIAIADPSSGAMSRQHGSREPAARPA